MATLLESAAIASCRGFSARLPIFLLCIGAVSRLLFSICTISSWCFQPSPLLAGVGIGRLYGSQYVSPRDGSPIFPPPGSPGSALAWPILAERKFLLQASPAEASRMVFLPGKLPSRNPSELENICAKHTSRNDTRIAVLGSEPPDFYFYSDRHSATGYIYRSYGLMEAQSMRQPNAARMIREIERARPKFLISPW